MTHTNRCVGDARRGIIEHKEKEGAHTRLAVIVSAMVLISVIAVMPTVASEWQQFQRDVVNSGITPDHAVVNPRLPPVEANGSLPDGLSWYYTTHSCSGFAGIDVTPIVANVDGEDVVFVHVCNGSAWAFYARNGTLKWKNTTEQGPAFGFQLATPAYSPQTNRFFVPTANGSLFIFNASTGHREVNPAGIKVCPGYQLNTPVVYYRADGETQGRIFFGDWNGPKKYYCYWENGTECWNRTSTSGGGYYWAGAAVIGDYLVYGDDAGYLTSVYLCNGTTVDELNVSSVFGVDAKEIRSSVTWNETYGRIYFTSKGGYCYALGFDKSTGEFNTSDKWHHDIGYSTSTPVVYNGRVYVGHNAGFSSGKLYCLDEDDGNEIWNDPVGPVQSSPAISTNSSTLYFTTNCEHGRVYCLYFNGTEAWHFETFESGTSRGYILQGVAISDDRVFFGNDGGVLYSITEKPGAPSKPDLTVTAIENATIYNGTYNIIHATVKNVGNGSAGAFDVSLKEGSTVVDQVRVAEGLNTDSEIEVKLVWTPTSTSTHTLTVTADSNDEIDEWNEGNNTMQKALTPIEIPPTDLVVSEVNDGALFNGTDNVVFAVIENRGADATGFNVSLAVNGAAVDKVFVPMLRFRDSQLVTFEWTPGSIGAVTLNVSIENGGFKTQTVNVALPETLTVSSGSSIQSEVNNASNNTIILVEPGVYEEQVTIPASKSGIRLIANGTGVIIQNNTYETDIITIYGDNSYVRGFEIISGWNGSTYPNFPGAGINISSDWNVVENNYFYNTSGGIKLYGSHNLVRCNEIGNSSAGRACLNLMAISGDCNMVQNNRFDGDTGYGFVLGGVFTTSGVTEADATNNVVRDNNFTVAGVPGKTQYWPPGNVYFGGDPNMVFNNIINDTSDKVELGRLNWYFVDKVAVENPMCGNIVHGPYYGGNYWLNYTGSDSNNDLLGDTLLPHLGYDMHPLIKAKCGDVNGDGGPGVRDAVAIIFNDIDTCEWAADVNCDCGVSIRDAVAIVFNQLNCCDPCYCCAG